VRRDTAFHPILFALFPVLSLYVYNIGRLPFREVIGVTLVVLLCTVLLWSLLGALMGSWPKSAVIASVFLVLFFSYGHVTQALTALLYQGGLLEKAGVLVLIGTKGALAWLLLMVAVLGAMSCLMAKSSGNLRTVTKTLNVISCILILSVGLNWMISQAGDTRRRQAGRAEPDAAADIWESLQLDSQEVVASEAGPSPPSYPDIYYIVLDGFARSDILKEMYDLDNARDLAELAGRGFYVADESRSNYCQTALSLASSLNLMYLDDLIDQIGRESDSIAPLEMAIERNRLFAHLRSYGYRVWAFSTGHSPTEITSAGRYLSPPWSPNSFHNELINTTPLTLLRKTQYDLHRERILYAFDHLADATQLDSPVFVFAHIIAPHPPFVFGAAGEPVQPDRQFTLFDGSDFLLVSTREEYVRGYRDQLTFITARMHETVAEIMERSLEPPIIVLQADHGPGSMLDWDSPQDSNLRERMAIFNAYYFPDQNYEALYPGISPVNTFRVILNRFFGAEYDILDDASYYSTLNQPYVLVDVTDQLEQAGAE
jgi:hypothetical protein